MQKQIYIADDEKNIRQLIQSFLTKEGFEVESFEDGEQLLKAFRKKAPDLLILDIMMPGMDGLSLCSAIRQESSVPIIFVSARDGALDRVTGITLGGDDYMVKPFLPLELVARVKALFRRAELSANAATAAAAAREPGLLLQFGDLSLDHRMHTALLREKPFAVTPTEFDFLEHMVKNSSRAVARDELLRELWQLDFTGADTRAADDLVKRLRKKLKDQKSTVHIETVWGFGFRLTLTEENS